MLEILEAKLIRLISFPLKENIQIDFDREKRNIFLSVPIYRPGKRQIPWSIFSYVSARKGMTFQPHKTSYQFNGKEVLIVQEIPFQWGDEPSLRSQVLEFWHLAKRCHQMMLEIGAEEFLDQMKI